MYWNRVKKVGLLALPLLVAALHTKASAPFPLPTQKPLRTSTLADFYYPVPNTKPQTKQINIIGDSLPADQAELYKTIFNYQHNGTMSKADQAMRKLEDERLLGHVLYQRYMHPTAYKSSFDELKYWLDMYADHPGASKIYKMATERKPEKFHGHIKKPIKTTEIARVHEPTVQFGKRYKSKLSRSSTQKKHIKALKTIIKEQLKRGAPTYALRILKTHKNAQFLDENEKNIIRSQIAYRYFYAGKYNEALTQARYALENSGDIVPLAGWIGGLVSWKYQNYEDASQFFSAAASSPYASGWTSAAASFWNARTYMRLGQPDKISPWLQKAYQHPRTFYGILATRALGKDFNFNWNIPTFTKKYFETLNAIPAGKRAIALVAAGQNHLAEQELLRIDIRKNSNRRNALLAYANFANLPALAMRLGNIASDAKSHHFYDTALYPISAWEPKDGYSIDPALIHAIMRQESRFSATAKNPSGARGLMQIMPRTASYITKNPIYKNSGKYKLLDPQTNLEIGQKYIDHLLKNALVKQDLVKMLVAYNAGAGNLKRWLKETDARKDPLLFIEMIPIAETRAYLERVLSNYWIYRRRYDRDIPTLDALAQGEWPRYIDLNPLEKAAYRIASQAKE